MHNLTLQTPLTRQLNLSHHFSTLLGWPSTSTSREVRKGAQVTWRIRTLSSKKICARYLPVNLCLRFWNWRERLFFSSLPRICFQMRVRDGNHMSVLSNIVHLLSTDSILPLSSQRWLASLCDSRLLYLLVPQLRSEFSNFSSSLLDHSVASPLSSVWNRLGCPLFRIFSCVHV